MVIWGIASILEKKEHVHVDRKEEYKKDMNSCKLVFKLTCGGLNFDARHRFLYPICVVDIIQLKSYLKQCTVYFQSDSRDMAKFSVLGDSSVFCLLWSNQIF